MKDRIEREKIYHNERFKNASHIRKSIEKYYSIHHCVTEYYYSLIDLYALNKKLLEVGCGIGSETNNYLRYVKSYVGIDISSEGIKQAIQNINQSIYEIKYFEMDIEKTTFEENSFDVVSGMGILHHLNLNKAYSELSRIIKDKGHIIFIEPLGHNPIINLYRKLTPKMRTMDEHPLKIKDIRLLSSYFHNVELRYFSLFTLIAVPFRNRSIFRFLVAIFKRIDDLVFKIPFFRKYAWVVIIHASMPINNR